MPRESVELAPVIPLRSRQAVPSEPGIWIIAGTPTTKPYPCRCPKVITCEYTGNCTLYRAAKYRR